MFLVHANKKLRVCLSSKGAVVAFDVTLNRTGSHLKFGFFEFRVVRRLFLVFDLSVPDQDIELATV